MSSSNDTAQVEVEYLQYVSGVSSHQEELNGLMVLKRTINANYALELPKVVSEIQLHDQIDSVMCSLYSDSLRNYEQASYAFFRRSAITNNENLGKNRKQFTDYSEENDILVSYGWNNGVFGARHEHYEGSIFPVNTKWYDWDYKCDLLRSE